MKTSKLIGLLQHMITEHGDLEVTDASDSIIDSVSVCQGLTEDYFCLRNGNVSMFDAPDFD